MARGCGAKKSAHKGKGKATGSFSSLVRKTKIVDEVTGVSEWEIPSPIQEKLDVIERKLEDETEGVPIPTMADKVQQWRRWFSRSGWR